MTAPNVVNDDTPDKPSKAVLAQQPAMTLCRDMFEGVERLREKAREYLPQYPAELPDNYQARVKRMRPFNAFERTVTGLVGMIFRKDPELMEDVPEQIVGDRDNRNAGGIYENVDLAGTHGDVYVRERATDGMVDGHAGTFVDFPHIEGAKPNLDEERRLKLRPYCVPVRKEQIVSFRTETRAGVVVISQLVLKFCLTEAKGEFGEEEVTEYRVYRDIAGVISFTVWRKGERDSKPVKGESGFITNQTAIPFAVLYGPRKTGVLVSKPPLEDVAHRLVSHLQIESDYLNSMHLAGSPVPFLKDPSLTGDESKKVSGPSWCIVSTDPGADFKYVEHSGAALDAFRTALEDHKGEIATLGLAMLQRDTRAAETAQGKRMDKSASDSALAVYSRNVQDFAETILHFMAQYLKLDDGGSITVNKDFEQLSLDPAMLQTLSNMHAAGQISLETMYAWAREGKIPDDFDIEDEKDKIRTEGLGPLDESGEPKVDPNIAAKNAALEAAKAEPPMEKAA